MTTPSNYKYFLYILYFGWLIFYLVFALVQAEFSFNFLWHIMVHLSLDLKQLNFLCITNRFVIAWYNFYNRFWHQRLYHLYGSQIVIFLIQFESSGQEFITHNIMNRNMGIFHTCDCRNALDIYCLAASLVGGISSGLFVVRMRFTRIESSEVSNLSLYKRHINFSICS